MKNEESTMKNWELKQQMLVINGLIERETDTVNLWIYYQLLSFLTYFLSATKFWDDDNQHTGSIVAG